VQKFKQKMIINYLLVFTDACGEIFREENNNAVGLVTAGEQSKHYWLEECQVELKPNGIAEGSSFIHRVILEV
jgi:hypothetical protein